jgi:signal transduction histidine kinase
MKQSHPRLWRLAELLIPVFVLGLLVRFTYGFFFEVPYSGFYFNPNDGRIVEIFEPVDSQPTLQVGDQLKQIGTVSWEAYHADRRLKFFENMLPGQVVQIIVERNGQQITIPWRFPASKQREFLFRFLNTWWLAFIFFFIGMAVQFFMRPKDARWQLLTAANYLTSCWLIAGTLSSWHMLNSSSILHAVTWLMLPVYLNFHWVFPKPLRQLPASGWIIFYFLSSMLAVGELFQVLPRIAYFLGLLCMLAGSIALLTAHFIRQPAQRRAVGLLVLAILIALAPTVSLAVLGLSGKLTQLELIGLLALPIMPGAYIFVVYRRQLGGLELRANRLLSLYSYLILLSTLLLLLVGMVFSLSLSPEAMSFLAVAMSVLTAFVSIRTFPAYKAFVENNLLGIKLPYQNLPETYSARITTSTSLSSLIQLLDSEILPSLLVREFAFLKLENGSAELLIAKGVTDEQALSGYDLTKLKAASGKYRPAHSLLNEGPYPWVHLILSLQVGESVLGFWLFGRRDPDDMYAQIEIPILQSLANQTAIALSNILQTGRLRAMYQANVDRYEGERLHLALDLHDSILNQLAVLQMNLDKPSQKFQEAYDDLTQRLREIVSDLRPPMLNYGLKPAIAELADNLMERSKDTIQINVDLQSDGNRYPEKIEIHLFRIVQEACENALRHAQAKNIRISGILFSQEIDLSLKDDGIGFDIGENLQLDALIANKHFGLAGMIERAAVIGAEARIESKQEKGTRVQITWKNNLV